MKQMKFFSLLLAVICLAACLIPIQWAAAPETKEKKGRIVFDAPGNPEAIVQINLSHKLLSLFTKLEDTPEMAELVQMIDGIYLRTHDMATVDEEALIRYYKNKLEKDGWESLVKIKQEDETVEIILLFDEVADGIFIVVTTSRPDEVTFINIVGSIVLDRIYELFENLSTFGMPDLDVRDRLVSKTTADRKIVKKKIPGLKIKDAPSIDGILDDPCWRDAPQGDDFTDMRTGNLVDDQTTVKLVYTDQAIYVAWYLYDSQPDRIIARQTQDQIRFANEDWVSFTIDPFHTHIFPDRTFFMANPLGKKYVWFGKGRPNKRERADDWKVAANIVLFNGVLNGWVVEMEIPWELLAYPVTTDPIQMGINFDRYQARTGTQSWWSNVGPDELYKNDGHWFGVLPPTK